MASRNSQSALRNSRSFSRLMTTRAMGRASPVRITRMAVATISSMSVNPSARVEAGFKTADFITILSSKAAQALSRRALLHRPCSHGPSHSHGLHGWIPRSAFRDGQSGLSAPLSHEGQSDYGALPGNAAGSRRQGRGDLQRGRRMLGALHQRHDLTVL